MEFSRQEYWGALPFPSPGDLPHPYLPTSPVTPALRQILYPLSHWGSSLRSCRYVWKWQNTTVSWGLNLVTVRLLPLLLSPSVMSDSFMTPMDCSLPGSSVYGVFKARLLQWVAISSSRGSSQPRDGTCASISRSPTLQVDSLPLSPMLSPTVRLGASKYGQPEMWVELHLQLGSYQTAASSQGNYNGH